MTSTTGAIAAAVVAVIGLVMYVLRRRDSPAAQYKAACEAYTKAVKDEADLLAQIKTELDKAVPDRALVAQLQLTVRAASRRVRETRETRDRLRP